jgi:hypothetical protein
LRLRLECVSAGISAFVFSSSLSDKVGAECTLAFGKVWASDALKLLRSEAIFNSSSASGLHRVKNATLQRSLEEKNLCTKIGDGMQSKRFISKVLFQSKKDVKAGNLTIQSTPDSETKPRQRHGYGQAAGDDKGGMGTHVSECGSDTSTRPEGVNVGSSVEESKFPSLLKSLKLLSRFSNLHHHFGQRSFSDATQSGDGANVSQIENSRG